MTLIPGPKRRGWKGPRHGWDNDENDPVAFLKCRKCGMEHTIGERIGRTGKFFWRMPGGEWRPAPNDKRPHCGETHL